MTSLCRMLHLMINCFDGFIKRSAQLYHDTCVIQSTLIRWFDLGPHGMHGRAVSIIYFLPTLDNIPV